MGNMVPGTERYKAHENGCICVWDSHDCDTPLELRMGCRYHVPSIDAHPVVDRESAVRTFNETHQWPTVCICGSMRFLSQMYEAAAKLTASGHIVLMPYSISESEDKIALDAMHRRKIDMADSIVVVTDHGNYIGDSTRAEILYAAECGKNIEFYQYPADFI